MIIFRVETKYGVYDAYTLRDAKMNSKPQDHIQAVAPDGDYFSFNENGMI